MPILEGSLLDKTALYDLVPADYESFLFLDSDTYVLGDLSYGFEKAEAFGIAAVMESHYSLDHFRGFKAVLSDLGLDCISGVVRVWHSRYPVPPALNRFNRTGLHGAIGASE